MDDHQISHITNLGRKKSPDHKGGLGFSGRSKISMHEAEIRVKKSTSARFQVSMSAGA
jgi:hypothetical protein